MRYWLFFIIALLITGCSNAIGQEVSKDIERCKELYNNRDYHVVTVINVDEEKKTSEEIGVISINSRVVCWYKSKSKPIK